MRWICGVVLGALLVAGAGCDRIKRAVEKVKETASEEVEAGRENAELAKLVDQNEDGCRFRRDVPFPERVRCRVERKFVITQGRMFVRDAFGEGSTPFEGAIEQTLTVERDKAVLSVKIERSRIGKSLAAHTPGEVEKGMEKEFGKEVAKEVKELEGGKKPKKNGKKGQATPEETKAEEQASLGNSLEGLELSFIHRKDGWHRRGAGNDFRAMAAGKQLAPVVDACLSGWGMVARSPWFGATRFSEGTELVLKGKQIALITGTAVKRGTAKLRFEKTESLGGHPCAVFTWSGDYDEETPNLEGETEQWEVTVSAGRLWCSLVYPLVLREEGKGMLTVLVRDSRGRVKRRLQGAVDFTESFQWNRLAAPEKKE